MSPYRRNVMVGVVVLGSLGLLGWMLIQFGGRLMSPFAPAQLKVRIVADRADGISNGSAVLYTGVIAGRVDKVSRGSDLQHVYIDASVDRQPPLPGNVQALIRTTVVGGGASIALETIDDAAPQGALAEGQTLVGRFLGTDLIPPEITSLATELRLTAQQFRESNLVQHVDEQVANVGRVMESVRNLVEDKQLRADLTDSLASIRSTTARADKIASNLEQFSGDLNKLSADASATVGEARTAIGKTEAEILNLSKQTSQRLEQTSKLLDQFYGIAEKVNKGQGSAGALVNDPRLYESLVETAKELNSTVADLRRLVNQWEQEGVSLKLR
jgi:phospholipid/cholesterol/gamma-HCH transport system substrate-binding protein